MFTFKNYFPLSTKTAVKSTTISIIQIRIDELGLDLKQVQYKRGVETLKGPVSPRKHFDQLTSLDERYSQEINVNGIQAIIIEGIKSLPTSPRGSTHPIIESTHEQKAKQFLRHRMASRLAKLLNIICRLNIIP